MLNKTLVAFDNIIIFVFQFNYLTVTRIKLVLTYLLTCLLTYLLTHSLTYLLTYVLTYSLTYEQRICLQFNIGAIGVTHCGQSRNIKFS